MQFSDLSFLFVFLPLILVANYFVKPEHREIVLVIFSLVFYAYGSAVFLIEIFVLSLTNIFLGMLITRARKEEKDVLAKAYLYVG